jgi:hypothetical protein
MEKRKSLQVLTLLSKSEPEGLEEDEDNEPVYAAKPDKSKPPPQPIIAAKKPRTEKQIAVFERAKETARVNAENRKIVAELRAKEQQEITDKKIVEKAIAIKKREIKRQAILDSVEDDDTPLEEIKKIVSLPAKKQIIKDVVLPPPVEKPKYIFV